MRKGLLALVIVLLLGGIAVLGQVPVPYTFVPGQVASSSQVNANFKALADNALNRAGGTVTGNIAVNPGVTIDGVDISSMLANSIITADRGMFIGTVLPQLSVGYDVPHSMLIGVGSTGNALFDLTAAGANFTFDDPVNFSNLATFSGGLACAGCIDASDIAAGALTGGQLAPGSIGEREIADGSVGPAELANTTVAPGTYGAATTIPTFTVDADGRITSAGNTGISLPASGVTAGGYGSATLVPQITVAADGRITGITNVTITHPPTGTVGSANENITGTWNFTNMTFLAANEGGLLRQSSTCGSGFPGLWVGSREGGQDRVSACFSASLVTAWGDIWPSEDDRWTLGAYNKRFKTANFALPNNPNPTFVVVNKGGGGNDASSAIGYIAAFTGSCPASATLTVKAGLITGC